jgi:hypothetical protein
MIAGLPCLDQNARSLNRLRVRLLVSPAFGSSSFHNVYTYTVESHRTLLKPLHNTYSFCASRSDNSSTTRPLQSSTHNPCRASRLPGPSARVIREDQPPENLPRPQSTFHLSHVFLIYSTCKRKLFPVRPTDACKRPAPR